MEAETFEFALPALSAVRDKWLRSPGGQIPSQEPEIIQFLTDVFRCYGKTILGYQIKEPYYMTSEIWSSSRIGIDIPDADHILTTVEIEYSEGTITFYSDSGVIPSTPNLNEEENRIFEETGEYEESDFYQEMIMWGLNPNTAPAMTVIINNITGAYRELGHLATQGFSDRSTGGYRRRTDEILSIHQSKNTEDACRLIYDILRDISLAEEDRRVIYAWILETIFADTRSLAGKQHFQEMLVALRDNHREPTSFMDLFRAVDPEYSDLSHLSHISTPFHGEQSALPDHLLDALIICAELDWNITVDTFDSLFPWRSRPPMERPFIGEPPHTADVILDPVCGEGVTLARAYFTSLTSGEERTTPIVIGFCARSWQATMAQRLLSIVDRFCEVTEPGTHTIQVTDPRTADWSESLPETSSGVRVVSDSRETAWLRAGDGTEPDDTVADTLDSKLNTLSRIIPVTVDIE